MTIHQENEQAASESNLLTSQELAICEQIATGQAPHSQRALALLALNQKKTQAQAAEQTGLSKGQVKYWVARFRKLGLAIFPDTRPDELDTEAKEALVEPLTETEEEPEPVTEKAGSAQDITVDTKKKKGKKAVKTRKKAKKDKGSKAKGKDSKKKAKGGKAKGTKKAKKGSKGKKAKNKKKRS